MVAMGPGDYPLAIPNQLEQPNWKCDTCNRPWHDHLTKKGQVLKKFRNHNPVRFNSNRASRRRFTRSSTRQSRKQTSLAHSQLHWLQQVRLDKFMAAMADEEESRG